MAHECPECSLTCHCGGDIDDLILNDDKHVNRCKHCTCYGCGQLRSECLCDVDCDDVDDGGE